MIQSISKSVAEASSVIGETWPLYTFVASNPLSGYENLTFTEAIAEVQKNYGTNAFPAAKVFRQAWEHGEINKSILSSLLGKNGLTQSQEEYLNILEFQKESSILNKYHELDRIMTKWLSAFMDEGLAEWEIPYKSEGFYTAWRFLVVYDSETGNTSLRDIPKTSAKTLEQTLSQFSEIDHTKILKRHLASLPGWTGYINHRNVSNSEWQQEYPIDLMDYLAARLWTAQKLNIPIFIKDNGAPSDTLVPKLQRILLEAWEQSWQEELLNTLKNDPLNISENNPASIPDAQMVFCIDTRSEHIRRHVEAKGNYETFGYAGFFGIAMDYKNTDDGIVRKSCPPIVNSAYLASEKAQSDNATAFVNLKRRFERQTFKEYFLKRMKNMLPSAFGYVEGSGFYYGLSIIGRTLFPQTIYKRKLNTASQIESICEPFLKQNYTDTDDVSSITLDEKITIVKSAFNLMGWKQFAPLVLFVGHGSHSANNPFGSSLDCGACAASPGRHNARMLAKLANDPEVRVVLEKKYFIRIPKSTFFIGAEHNTTTDEIVLFDAHAPTEHIELIKDLKINLTKAQETATESRLNVRREKSITKSHQKANNWSETRPEWGLAKNAGFIIGPRSMSKQVDLKSRCFLHSYNWKMDEEGKALEGIMQGPMVVTQWINNHYYFSTVNNDLFGGGTKITHNITGRFGVVQGNGGDLKMGLPLQSLYSSDEEIYHQPLRLSVVIKAPMNRVSEIIARNENLRTLVDNQWIYIMIMDPNQDNAVFKYKKSLQWELVGDEKMVITKSNEEKIALLEV